jgi:3-hydroxyisobutyrate dehydrogenase-like beta-hydroxyacid dehydrogenase
MSMQSSLAGQSIGFIGLGRMGAAMARRLLAAGAALTVCDLDAAACETLRAAGATVADDAAAVADRAALVFMCLPSAQVSREVALGSRGLVHGQAVRSVVECSTIGPRASGEIAAGLQARGIAFIDAPISGGVAGAEAATLTSVVSGPPEHRAVALTAIACWASTRIEAGANPGAAQVYKLVNQALTFATMVLAAEALACGVKAGAEPAALLDFVNASTGRNWATSVKFPQDVMQGRTGTGSLAIPLKDLRLYLEMCRETGTPSLLGGQALLVLEMVERLLPPPVDLGSVADLFEQLAQMRFAPAAPRSK